MQFPRPNLGTVLGGLALVVALGGTAWAVTSSTVNIADPTTPSQIAHVDSSGKLQVGGTVNAQVTAPANYFHASTFGISSSSACLVVATPPAGKALVVREVRLDVFADPTPGQANDIAIFRDATCNNANDIVADVNPATIGQIVIPFDPGIGVPSASHLSVVINGSVSAESYVDGYVVPSTAVPAASVSSPASGPLARPRQ